MRRSCVFASIPLFAALACAQSVISVRSGVINYFEGAVFVDSQLVGKTPGRYPVLREGSDLLTHDGRAEILLAPDVYFRVGPNSGVRMISSGLADTRLELLSGSAIFDSGNAPAGAATTVIACGARIRIERPSRVRIDSDSAQLRVEKGEAAVDRGGETTKVEVEQMLSLTGAPVPRRMADISDDDLELWSQQRNRLIFISLANDRNILDPGDPGGGAGDSDAGAWLGYLPAAAILPLTGTYASVFTPGYGYYSAWSALAFYGPVYGRYPGLYGFSVRPLYRPSSSYRPIPVFPGSAGAFAPRPSGGIRFGPPGSVVAFPRPAVPRPVMPHPPVRR